MREQAWKGTRWLVAALPAVVAVAAMACGSDSESSPGGGGSGNAAGAGGTQAGGSAGALPDGGAGTSQGGANQGGANQDGGGKGGAAGASGAGGTSGTGGTAGGAGEAGAAGDGGTPQSITAINNGIIPEGTDVSLTGVVAMSRKFLVSKSNSGSCLWGFFASEPGLTEVQAYSGIIVLSYGNNAEVPDGGSSAYCPVLGKDPTGGGIPDDIKPGDVLDLTGKTASYLPAACGSNASDSQTETRQIGEATITKTGTAAVPAAHVISSADIAKLASPALADQGFKDMWGNALVRVTNVTAQPLGVMDGGTSPITDQYGNMQLAEGSLMVGDKLYYVGALKSTDACHSGPVYGDGPQAFQTIDGFLYLDYCTWKLEPRSKCTDLNPSSTDCDIGGSSDPATHCLHD